MGKVSGAMLLPIIYFYDLFSTARVWKSIRLRCFLSPLLFCFHLGLFNYLQWLKRRQAHLLGAQEGIPVSAFGVSSILTVFLML